MLIDIASLIVAALAFSFTYRKGVSVLNTYRAYCAKQANKL